MRKNRTIKNLLVGAIAAMGIILWMSCNKGFDRVLASKDYTDTTSAKAQNPKVLYVIVAGARGQSVRDANPPNIMNLTQHAIYCWNTVTDTLTRGLTGFADLLTGVHKEKHMVLGDDLSNNDLKDYPAFFKYVKQRKPDLRIAAFSSNDSISTALITDANVNKSFNGDDAKVQAAAISELGVDSATLVMAEYGGVKDAGDQYGYDVSVPQYKAAILKVDGYIGALVDAVKKRPNYASENWMIVVTTDHGGPFAIDPTQDDHTILSNPNTNGFVIFNAPHYQAEFNDKPYTGNRYEGKAVELHGTDADAVKATVPDDHDDYNFGAVGEFTVEFKIKSTPNGDDAYNYHYPSIVSKRASFDPDVTGWCIFLEDKHWQFNVGQVGKDNIQVAGSDIGDGTWHDIAVVVVMRDGKRYARTFTDGNFNNEVEITGIGDLSTTAPLTIGFIPGSVQSPADVFLTEVRIWNAALSDGTISQYACETALPGDHPNNDNLIGYWPAVDGQGGVIKDHSTLLHDFVLQGAYNWQDFSDLICPPASSDLASQMPQPVDVPRQIMDWLQVSSLPQWGLDGRAWTTNYTGIQN